jgi:acetyl esterase
MLRIVARLMILFVLDLLLIFVSASHAQEDKEAAGKPPPDIANFPYGPHPRNVLDLWQAKSERPAPLVIHIHGGGFYGGDKSALHSALLDNCLKAGISVASINYRLSPEVKYPAHYRDCARAIQMLRLRAKEWNIDPTRIGATGGSAGAGTSLWIGFHDDLADPASEDPVLRQSTRLTCMAVSGAQTTYSPPAIRKIVGGRAHEHPALKGFYGLTETELEAPEAQKLFDEAAPITWLTADDPPVYAYYYEPKGPLPPDAKPGQGIHHPNFGTHLKEAMNKLRIRCIVRHKDDGADGDREMADFFRECFEK